MLQVLVTHAQAQTGTKPVRVTASDFQQYWVKSPDSAHGLESILAEFVVHHLGVLLKAPVVPCELISIPPGFENAPYSMRPGLGHASKDIANTDQLEEMCRTTSDSNSKRQARLLGLWDLCMGADPQWLFDFDDDFSIYSHDHGGWFLIAEGAEWDPSILKRFELDPRQYDHVEADALDFGEVAATAKAIRDLTDHEIDMICEKVPAEWNVPSSYVDAIARCLKSRRAGVHDRLMSLVKSREETL